MNGVFEAVDLKMLEELAKKGAITNKRFSDKKKYLKELVRLLYLNCDSFVISSWIYKNRFL